MAGMLQQVTQKIIDLLSADSELSGLKFYFGPPFTRNISSFIYVAWRGGPIEPEDTKHEVWRHRWDIVAVEIAQEDDIAEKMVTDRAERISTVLKANRTLDGLVRDSRVVRMTGENVSVGVEWGKVSYVIAAARVTLLCELVEAI